MKGLILVSVFLLFGSCCAQVTCPPTGIEVVPHLTDCTQYYECNAGNLSTLACQPGTVYDYLLQHCDPAAVCPPPFICPPGVIDYLPYYEACQFYAECYAGTPIVMFCNEGYYFDKTRSMCVPEQDSGCGEYASSTTTMSTPSSECSGVLPGTIVLRPVPGDCTQYQVCDGNRFNGTYSCPPGLFFDEIRYMCNMPSLVNCNGTLPTTQTPTITTTDPRCGPGENDYFPDLNDCSKYIECHDGIAHEMSCPPGLFFDVATKQCTVYAMANCFSTTASTPATPTEYPPNPNCANEPNGKTFPFPGHCHLYLECVSGEIMVQECPEGLYYNQMLEVCDYPYEAHCPWAKKK